MRNKILTLLAVISLILTVFCVTALAAEPAFTVSNVECLPGGYANVTISVSDNPGIVSLGLNLDYEDGITLEEITVGSVFAPTDLMNPPELLSPVILSFDAADLADTTRNGALITLKFKMNETIDASAEKFDVNISYSAGNCINVAGDDVDFTCNSGVVAVKKTPVLDNGVFTYDGTAKSLTASNLTYGSTVSYTNNGMTDAGTYTVKAAVTSFSGTTNISAQLKINPVDIQVTSLNPETGVAAFDNVIPADADKVEVASFVATLGAENGADTEVTVTAITLGGEKAGNYNLTSNTFNTTVPTANLVTVSANAENGSVSGIGKYIKNSTVTLQAITEVGYRFAGWQDAMGNEISNRPTYTFTATEDVTFTAIFEERKNGGSSAAHSVEFITNGGTAVERQLVSLGRAVEPKAPTREGYLFAGWYTDKKFTTKYDFNDYVITSIKLYAKWVEEVTASDWVNPFKDVKASDWYFESVKKANYLGIMNGVSADEFDPDKNLTRAMFVTMLYRLEKEPAVTNGTIFTDVKADAYYANAVAWAFANNIVNGTTQTTFSPDAEITREQMAAIIYRYAMYKDADRTVGYPTYSDSDKIAGYALDPIVWVTKNNVMNGKTASTFAPKANATRAEAAAVITRMFDMSL